MLCQEKSQAGEWGVGCWVWVWWGAGWGGVGEDLEGRACSDNLDTFGPRPQRISYVCTYTYICAFIVQYANPHIGTHANIRTLTHT